MEKKKKIPLNFFEKIRPTTKKDEQTDIEPINWSKEVINGKKEILVTLPKEK